MNKSEEIHAGEDYKFMNLLSGQALDRFPGNVGPGGGMRQLRYSGEAYQKWRLLDHSDEDYYEIETRQYPYLNMDIASNNALMSGQRNNGESQKWKLEKNNDGTYTIRNKKTNLVIALNGSYNENEQIITVEYKDKDQRQRWHIDPAL